MSEIKPRPYQEEAKEIVDNLPDGSRVIIHMATGLGKTALMSMFTRRGRTLILSHRDELVRQPEKYFTDVSFGIEKAEEHAHGEDIVSASVQTLCKDSRLNKYAEDDFDTIIIDEAHHAAAPSYKHIINHFSPRLLIGLTATPKRGDNARLDDVFDEIVFSRDLMWGIKNGYLSNVRSLAIRTDISLDKVSMTAGDYNQRELANAIDIDEMYDAIIKTYKQYVADTDRHVIIYCLNVKSCEMIQNRIHEELPDEVGRTAIITGSTPQELRTEYQDSYMNGEIRCLINCMVLTEGVDLPITDTIIIARPTANETLYTQIIGRGTRLYEGKTSCLVLDILPESTHKLCCAATLAGIDMRALSPSEQQELLEKELDLAEIIRQKEEEELRQRQLADVLTLRVQEYDFINGIIIDKKEELYENSIKGIGHLANTITGNQSALLQTAAEEDGISDFYGMHYHLGRTDDTRYQFKGADQNYLFTVSKPDMLGKSTAEGYINGVRYQTEKPQPVDDILYTIRSIFQQDCFQLYYWNQDTIDSWKASNATGKQLDYMKSLLRKNGIPIRGKENISKYEASMMIDHMLQLKKLEEEAKTVRRDMEKLQIQQKAAKNRSEQKHPLQPQVQQAPPKNNMDTRCFEDLIRFFEKRKIPEEIVESIQKKTILNIEMDDRWLISEIEPPTEKQLGFVNVLYQRLRSKSVQFDIQLPQFILRSQNSNEISRLIHILKEIDHLPDYMQYGYHAVVELEPAMKQITDQNILPLETFSIIYYYKKQTSR